MSVMQRGESTCPLCCPICPSHSPLPFTSSCAGLAHYPSGNLGRGEIVVILDNLLLKVQDGRAVPSLFCHPGQKSCVFVGKGISWSCHGVGCCPGGVQIREGAGLHGGAMRLLWGCVSHPSHGSVQASPGSLSSRGGRQFSTLGCDRTTSGLEKKAKSFLGYTYFIYKRGSECQAGKKEISFLQVTRLCLGGRVTTLLDKSVHDGNGWMQQGPGL